MTGNSSHPAMDDRDPITGLTREEMEIFEILQDPVLFAESFFGWRARPHQALILRHPSLRQVLRIGRRGGKCVSEDSGVLTVEGPIEAAELYARDDRPAILTFDETTFTITTTPVYEIWPNGRKPIYEIRTRSGRRNRVTGNHPFLAIADHGLPQWIEAAQLQVGHRLAAPATYEGMRVGRSIGTDRARSLGYDCARSLIEPKQNAAHRLAQGSMSERRSSVALACSQRTSADRVPKEVMAATEAEVAEFLRAYWSCQGRWETDAQVGQQVPLRCDAPSERFARDLQHLLLRLGIVAHVSHRGFWRVEIRDVRSAHRLLQRVVSASPAALAAQVPGSDGQGTSGEPCVLWDPIVSIEVVGVGETYDLHVPGTHTLIADDIISHNTDTLAVKALHKAYVNGKDPDDPRSRGFVSIIVTPEEVQVARIFKRIREFIDASPELSASVSRDRQNPQIIEFYNGSEILGFTAGTKSGSGASALRGQRADWIFLDEADYLSDEDINTILPIAAEAPDRIGIWASSTPSGRRSHFWRWCMNGQKPDGDPEKIWHEFYYPSPDVIPHWDARIEAEFRELFPEEIVYQREVLALFGEEAYGVYPAPLVDEASQPYRYQKTVTPGVRMMGVDWDKHGAGPEIVVLEAMSDHDRQVLRVIWRESIPRGEYALDKAVQKVVELHGIFQPQKVYVDQGLGEYQVERLKILGKQAQEGDDAFGLDSKVRGIAFKENITLRDPASGTVITKPAKNFMVSLTQMALERKQLQISKDDRVLRQQMLEYNAHITKHGNVTYLKGRSGDHVLDALHLAVLAFGIEHPNLFGVEARPEVLRQIAVGKGPVIPSRLPARSWGFSQGSPSNGSERLVAVYRGDERLEEGQGWIRVDDLREAYWRRRNGSSGILPAWGRRGGGSGPRRRSF